MGTTGCPGGIYRAQSASIRSGSAETWSLMILNSSAFSMLPFLSISNQLSESRKLFRRTDGRSVLAWKDKSELSINIGTAIMVLMIRIHTFAANLATSCFSSTSTSSSFEPCLIWFILIILCSGSCSCSWADRAFTSRLSYCSEVDERKQSSGCSDTKTSRRAMSSG